MSEYADVARKLFDMGCVKFGEFRLKLHERQPDAPLSPVYVDLRLLQSHPGVLRDVAGWMALSLGDYRLSAGAEGSVSLRVAGVPVAGVPIATAVSLATGVPAVTPRTDRKAHGTGAPVDGEYAEGDRVVLVDDLITGADSKLEAIGVLERAGLAVAEVLVVLDREQGGSEELRGRGYRVVSMFKMRELLSLYRGWSLITDEQFAEVYSYMGWGKDAG